LVRPTKSGATMWGKTTRSLNGKSGKSIFDSSGSSSFKSFGILAIIICLLFNGFFNQWEKDPIIKQNQVLCPIKMLQKSYGIL
jgi:hypothetical protein